MKKKEFVLGNKVKGIVTGFEGIATARHEYLNNCIQISITGLAHKDTGEVHVMEVDEEQVKYVGLGLIESPKKPKKRQTGGPSTYRMATRKA